MKQNIIFAVLIAFSIQYVNGQNSTIQGEIPYLNCVFYYSQNYSVTLQLSDKCNEHQFKEAINYYRANGYPIEKFYYQFSGTMGLEPSK
jgi:hypothetical protein